MRVCKGGNLAATGRTTRSLRLPQRPSGPVAPGRPNSPSALAGSGSVHAEGTLSSMLACSLPVSVCQKRGFVLAKEWRWTAQLWYRAAGAGTTLARKRGAKSPTGRRYWLLVGRLEQCFVAV